MDIVLLSAGEKEISAFLETLKGLIELLLNFFGPTGTILLMFILLLLSIGWRLYNDYRKDNETNRVIEEKERTIQRMAKQERELKIVIFKKIYKWTDEQVERFIMKADYDDGPSARKALEEKDK